MKVPLVGLIGMWHFIKECFTVRCPFCERLLARSRSEDYLMDYQHTCYKCGSDFVELSRYEKWEKL